MSAATGDSKFDTVTPTFPTTQCAAIAGLPYPATPSSGLAERFDDTSSLPFDDMEVGVAFAEFLTDLAHVGAGLRPASAATVALAIFAGLDRDSALTLLGRSAVPELGPFA